GAAAAIPASVNVISSPIDLTPADPLANVGRELFERIRQSQARAARVDHYLERVAQSTGTPTRSWTRHVDRILNSVAHKFQGDSPFNALLAQRLTEAYEASNEMASQIAIRAIEQLLRHPLITSDKPILTATGTIEALARIENAVEKSRPDLMVVVNEGRSI